jgi:hypothetical protein
MKSLQEQYNLIKEGKGAKDVFLKNAKSLFPDLIPNHFGYNETTTILKQRSIISENIGGVVTGNKEQPDWFKIFNEAKAVEKKPTKEVVDTEIKGFDYKNKKNIDNVYGPSFLQGFYTEMQDPKNADKDVDQLKEIVAKNLAKDIQYYTKDGQFGLKGVGYTEDHPGLGPTKEVTGKYASSGMEVVKENKTMISLVDLLEEGYSEFQRDDKGSKDVTAKDKGEQDAYGAGVKKGEKIEKKKLKKESVQDRIKEIEKKGSVAALEAKMNALDEEIGMREGKLSMVEENADLAEFVNPSRINEMKKEIKELSKAKEKYGKMYEKMTGEAYVKPQVMDEAQDEE